MHRRCRRVRSSCLLTFCKRCPLPWLLSAFRGATSTSPLGEDSSPERPPATQRRLHEEELPTRWGSPVPFSALRLGPSRWASGCAHLRVRRARCGLPGRLAASRKAAAAPTPEGTLPGSWDGEVTEGSRAGPAADPRGRHRSPQEGRGSAAVPSAGVEETIPQGELVPRPEPRPLRPATAPAPF